MGTVNIPVEGKSSADTRPGILYPLMLIAAITVIVFSVPLFRTPETQNIRPMISKPRTRLFRFRKSTFSIFPSRTLPDSR